MAVNKYQIVYNGQLGLYVIVSSSGELPDELTGLYTHQRLARKALDNWLQEMENATANRNKQASKPKRTGISN